MNDKIQNKMSKASGPVIFAVTILLWLSVFVAAWSHMAHGYTQANLWFESCVAAQDQILEVIAWSLTGQLFALALWRTRRFSAVALLLVGTSMFLGFWLFTPLSAWLSAWGRVLHYYFLAGPLAWFGLGGASSVFLGTYRRFYFRFKGLAPFCLVGLTLCLTPFVLSGLMSPSPKEKNIVLISIDALSAKHLKTYGYVRETAPNITSFSSKSQVFQNAYSHSSWTLPSHASMFTGLEPVHHGASTEESILEKRYHTLAEVLRNAGYNTAAFVDGFSGFFLDDARGFAQGFNLYDQEGGGSEKIVPKVLSWLKMQHKPYFLFVHLYDVHLDYDPDAQSRRLFVDPHYQGKVDGFWTTLTDLGCDMHPNKDTKCLLDEQDKQHLVDLYDAEIYNLDKNMAPLLSQLKTDSDAFETVVFFTADHGSEFFEHEGFNHNQLYEESLRVPLVVRGLDHAASLRKARPVWGADIFPSVLEIIQQGWQQSIDGVSLFVELNEPRISTFSDVHTFGLRFGPWKMLCPQAEILQETKAPKCQLFNIEQDPGELENQWQAKATIAESMLLWLKARFLGEKAQASPKIQLDEAALERLKALGYLR